MRPSEASVPLIVVPPEKLVLRWCSQAKHAGLSSPRPGFKSRPEHSISLELDLVSEGSSNPQYPPARCGGPSDFAQELYSISSGCASDRQIRLALAPADMAAGSNPGRSMAAVPASVTASGALRPPRTIALCLTLMEECAAALITYELWWGYFRATDHTFSHFMPLILESATRAVIMAR